MHSLRGVVLSRIPYSGARPRFGQRRRAGVCEKKLRQRTGDAVCAKAKGKPFRQSDVAEWSSGSDGDIDPKEWPVIQRIADRLFPVGTTDWEKFWLRDDYDEWYDRWRHYLEQEGGLDASLPEYEASRQGQREWLVKAMQYLKTRSDYVSLIPGQWTAGKPAPDPPRPAKEFDPDWDDWDFRAMMEKRWAREKSRRAWRKKQRETLGKYRYIDTVAIDFRLSQEDREAHQWTDEEMWDIITQKGRAFDPRKDKGPWRELDPEELPDWAGEGVEYVEEIDEYIENQGLMVEDKAFFERQNARLAEEKPLDGVMGDLKDLEDVFADDA